MAKRKPSPQASAKKKADRLFSQLIRRERRCEYDNCTAQCTPQCEGDKHSCSLQCAHWISRRYSHTRTDFDNAFCLCAHHHRWFTDHPVEWARWTISKRGQATYDRLFEQSCRRSKFDWIAELERLEQMRDRWEDQ